MTIVRHAMQRHSSFALVLFMLWCLVLQGCTIAPPEASHPTIQPSVAPTQASATAAPTPAPTSSPRAVAQSLAPRIASYQMDVRLDPAAKTLSGSERITYRNAS